MQRFLTLDLETQRLAMEQAAAAKGLAFVAVEKDFWVCWTLEQLFQLPEIGGHLTFKGGTSLSKVYGLIDRFSEDIDLVVDKAYLGFSGDRDPEAAPSNAKRKDLIKALKSTCSEVVSGAIMAALNQAFQGSLPLGRDWSLTMDLEDSDRQTILFNYPRLDVVGAGYLRQWVKIELGARSDIDPAQVGTVRSEVALAFPQLFDQAAVGLRALDAERTFLEKVTLLHEESFRPSDKPRAQKLARHYYDVARMIQKGVGARALASRDLFQRVVEHRRIYFKQTWVDYDTMAPGSLRIVPDGARMTAWEQDYQAMQREMFYGTPPTWPEVIEEVSRWEDAFNHP